MVSEITRSGLIVAQTARTSPLLAELISLCNWPVVWRPSSRTLFEQIDIGHPFCLAFWLESDAEIEPAAELVARLRDRGPRPYRIAIAHCLAAEIESTFRAAGVHTYFAVNGDLAALVDAALLPFVEQHRAIAHSQATHPVEGNVPIRGPKGTRASPTTLRPP